MTPREDALTRAARLDALERAVHRAAAAERSAAACYRAGHDAAARSFEAEARAALHTYPEILS